MYHNVTINICLPSDSGFWYFFSFVPFLLFGSYPFRIIYALYDNVLYIIYTTIWLIVFSITTYSLQLLFKWERPHPECVPFFCFYYGFPVEEITSPVAIVVTIIFYWNFFHKKERKKKEYTVKPISLGQKCFLWYGKIFNILLCIFLIFGYPFLIYMFLLCSFWQMVISIIYSVLITLLVCFFIKSLIHIKKQQEYSQNTITE